MITFLFVMLKPHISDLIASVFSLMYYSVFWLHLLFPVQQLLLSCQSSAWHRITVTTCVLGHQELQYYVTQMYPFWALDVYSVCAGV